MKRFLLNHYTDIGIVLSALLFVADLYVPNVNIGLFCLFPMGAVWAIYCWKIFLQAYNKQ